MKLAAELEASLRALAGSEFVEVRENGGRVARLAGLSWEVRGAGEKPLLHLWSEKCNLTRRVLAIVDHSEERLALAVERFGKSKPDRLEFVRSDFALSAREVSREEFCMQLKHLLATQFPDETLESLTVAADLEHSLSGSYVRGLLRRGSLYTAILAVADGESADTVENSLTFGLLWLEKSRRSSRAITVSGLRLILPKGAGAAMILRFGALDPGLALEVFERDTLRETLEKLDPRGTGNLDSWLVQRTETQILQDQARAALAPIVALAPQAIRVHSHAHSRQVWLRFRGLAFAYWEDDRIFFEAGDSREELTGATKPALKKLLQELESHRQPLSTDTRHPFYRAQPERWMESMICEDITRIDATLDAKFVYQQVFANIGVEHGILDLLCLTRYGRLAILELKATEHIHLPLQAADYWLRIKRHLQQHDFERYGYFAGRELQMAPPIVYLVAPALRFHPTTDIFLRYFSSELEVIRVGLVENWRKGINVVMRQ